VAGEQVQQIIRAAAEEDDKSATLHSSYLFAPHFAQVSAQLSWMGR